MYILLKEKKLETSDCIGMRMSNDNSINCSYPARIATDLTKGPAESQQKPRIACPYKFGILPESRKPFEGTVIEKPAKLKR